MTTKKQKITSIFWWITEHPKKVILMSMMLILVWVSFLPMLTIDSRSESFLPPDSPALLYRDQVEETFGLKDPMVIAIVNEGVNGIFNPESLQLVKWLTDEVLKISDINPDRVVSLATEDNITGNEEGMLVEPFLGQMPFSQHKADELRDAVMDFPLYLGSLVARDGSATLIVTETYDTNSAPKVYDALMKLVEGAPTNGEQIHVAGDGAVSGYLVTYINADASRLVPISVIIISLLCFIALRTMAGMAIPGIVILAGASSALGVMAVMGVPIYVITTSMPILLVGVAVADSLHVMSQYYEEVASRPQSSQQDLVITTMELMWRPVTITTLTSMVGFLGIAVSSFMPPMQAFGLYSLIGLGIAGLFSMTFVPAALMLLKPRLSPAFNSTGKQVKMDIYARSMSGIGHWVLNHTKTVLVLAAGLTIVGAVGISKLEINESWVENFQPSDPISLADVAINKHMDGTNTLDIVIETPEPEGLFNPENLKKIEALQNFIVTLPHVQGSSSIVDYIKQMNRSLNANNPSDYRIPDDQNLISQYFLLYSASGDPTDFEEEIDYDYQKGLVRARLNSARYQQTKVVVEATQRYLDETFNTSEIKATLSGRVNVDYEWLESLLGTQFKSVIFALISVWVIVSVSLRSIYGGSLALIPVALGALSVYAFMGFTGITLAVGTSMTAAIALGIGVDFAIHTLDKIKLLIKEKGMVPEDALMSIYPSTGRALFFSFIAVFIGFGILGLSYVPPLAKLGVLIAFAVLISFVTSMTVLPALIKHLKPRFLGFSK